MSSDKKIWYAEHHYIQRMKVERMEGEEDDKRGYTCIDIDIHSGIEIKEVIIQQNGTQIRCWDNELLENVYIQINFKP
jgi:hypothetical protein